MLRLSPIDGTYGIGHTRWATHGRPTEENAHPHRDCHGDIVVVHNGIVENYLALKQQLTAEGHRFVHRNRYRSDRAPGREILRRQSGKRRSRCRAATDRRVRAERDLAQGSATRSWRRAPGPPVVVGLGDGEYFVASDVPAILSHTRDMFFLADGDMAVLTRDGVHLTDFNGRPVKRQVSHILWDPIMAEKGGYKHFMLKEIFEQPRAVRDTTLGRVGQESGRIFLDEMDISPKEFKEFQQVRIIACGTSWHAALAGKFMIERLARIPVEVDYGSEFRYRDPIVGKDTLTVVISQSGETADTLAAQREAKQKGSKTLAICNVVGSMITREAAGTLITHAGPEIGVASTKAFTAQLTALFLMAMYLGQVREHAGRCDVAQAGGPVAAHPGAARRHSAARCDLRGSGQGPVRATDFLYLGRGMHFPMALEGALKLKEISYIHAEGYPAGEMKHGPNALIDEQSADGGAGDARSHPMKRAACCTRRRCRTFRK